MASSFSSEEPITIAYWNGFVGKIWEFPGRTLRYYIHGAVIEMIMRRQTALAIVLQTRDSEHTTP